MKGTQIDPDTIVKGGNGTMGKIMDKLFGIEQQPQTPIFSHVLLSKPRSKEVEEIMYVLRQIDQVEGSNTIIEATLWKLISVLAIKQVDKIDTR